MDAGVVSDSLHPAPDPNPGKSFAHLSLAGAGKLPSTLRVTAARGHLRRHRSSTMLGHRRRRASLHLTPRRS
jgi:hypothetical protein